MIFHTPTLYLIIAIMVIKLLLIAYIAWQVTKPRKEGKNDNKE